MKNRDVFARDPLSFELLNNGVSKVGEVSRDEQQLATLRFELEHFVCEGEYERGMVRMLEAYLAGLNKPEQQAVWVSGFFGSGKSHLVKMLRYLWKDFAFADGTTARSVARLPKSVTDLLAELTNRGKRYGGLRAAAGTLGAGSMDSVRLSFLQLIFRAADLPENLSAARFVLWLRERKLIDPVSEYLVKRGRDPQKEFANFYVSTPLGEALAASDPSLGSAKESLAAIRSQFPPKVAAPTIDDTIAIIKQLFGDGKEIPCTLLVIDEIQQYIGDGPHSVARAMDVQEIAECCSNRLNSRLLLVGTGQSALSSTTNLGRLQARFGVKVQLSDADVENVIRQTVLLKKEQRKKDVQKAIDDNQGEISRHLQSSRLARVPNDDECAVADYPLLPVRRRFWERVLRRVDTTGTKAQLRTQLMIVFQAVRDTAKRDLGCVVAADSVYDQVSAELLNSGLLQKEYHETIAVLRAGTGDDPLKSRLCSLMFLIQQLPHEGTGDLLVRATADTLADLLVEDLATDGARLRREVPSLLDEMARAGKVMLIDNEYVLQTREGAAWTQDFNRRRAQILGDEPRLGQERSQTLQQALEAALRSLDIAQGASRESRSITTTFSASRPGEAKQGLVLWVRDGWTEQEKTVAGDARAAGDQSPMLFGYLPRTSHNEFREHLATRLAAQEVIDAHGTPSGGEAEQAYSAMKTRLASAESGISTCMRQVLTDAKVFLGGGTEVGGVEFVDAVRQAGESALQRLFPRFVEADHLEWAQVRDRAKAGDLAAMQAVGHRGDPMQHAVCREIFRYIGAGKKGREVREQFLTAPYGWSRDAIDSALVVLMLAGNLRATCNGQPVDAKTLPQNQIGIAVFTVDVPPLTANQKLELRALFQKAGVQTPNGQESIAAATFLAKMLDLAQLAGGDAPLPERPEMRHLRELQSQSGNAQLLAVHSEKDRLVGEIDAWSKRRDNASKRLPRWESLRMLLSHARDISEALEIAQGADAVLSGRSLLADPDPVPSLAQQVVGVLRTALTEAHGRLSSAYETGMKRLSADASWRTLTEAQRSDVLRAVGISPLSTLTSGTEDQILIALSEMNLAARCTMVEAMTQRFQRALEDAARILEPKAARVTLPGATIRNEEELEAWVSVVRAAVKKQLAKGPVIL